MASARRVDRYVFRVFSEAAEFKVWSNPTA